MNINVIGGTGYQAAGRAMVRQAQDGTQRFDREMVSQTPSSFVGKVLTREELMQSVDKQVQSNQSKKMSISDMVKATCMEGTRAKFRFAGEDKIYTFDEYIKELDKRSKNNVPEKFDSAEDALKCPAAKETERARAYQTEVADETQEADSITDMQVNMLLSETVQARFPLEELDEEGNRKEDMYLSAVDKDGIRCSKPGQEEYEWEILFTDESQYENATEFLNYAGEFMDNFRFAAHENFWEDYLNGNMDVDNFKEFLEGTNNGIPDYSITVGDSMYVDKEKVQWAQYMNPLGVKFYTAEEMAQMQAELIEKNTATLHKLSDPYSILYKKLHPEYNGERIFCEYPGGPLYTADEIMEIMNHNLKDAKY